MQAFSGSIVLVDRGDLVQDETRDAVRMQAALAGYPWEAAAQRSLTGAAGCGAFAIHARDRMPDSDLLPILGPLTIAADVRLDNRAELYAALEIDVGDQSALADAGLILRAYQRWGIDCTSHLLGDFAFAIWDATAGRLFCARDFIGARPFYYCHLPGNGRLIFASDLLAMAAHPDVPLEFNLPYISATLRTTAGEFTHPEHTYYRSIDKLPPAHCLTFDARGVRSWAYWQPGQTPERRYAAEQDYVEELRALLRTAVECRTASPHPIGAHISGGLDSSSVAVLAHRSLQSRGRSITGFSWAPPLPEDPALLLPNDERKLVEATRQMEGFPVRYTCLTPEHVVAYARRDLTLQPTTTLLYELAVSETAATMGIRTMLSGWGGDELPAFNGRGYFSDLLRRGHWGTLQRELTMRRQLHGGGAVWRQWIGSGLLPLLPTRLLRILRPDELRPPRDPFSAYLRPGFASSLAAVEPLTQPEGRERAGVRRMQIALLQHGHLSHRMESWASHGATLGIAYAYPLLDRRLVEFALSIPDYLFFKNGWKRYLYRTAVAGILPDSLRWQKIKEDPAMVYGVRGVQREAEESLRAELLARAGNPYVDVEKLQAALDAEEPLRNAYQDDNLSRRERRRLLRQTRAGRDRWLAFVGAGPNQDAGAVA